MRARTKVVIKRMYQFEMLFHSAVLLLCLQGMDAVSEHYHHMDSYYVTDGIQDMSFTGERLPSKDALRLQSCASDASNRMEVGYVWAPGDIPFKAISNLEADILIGGLHYWSSSDFSGYQHTFERLFGQHQDAFRYDRRLDQVFWLATPQLDPQQTWLKLPESLLANCSAALRHLTNQVHHNGFRNFHLVPFDSMAAENRFQRNEQDHTHWQCSFAEYPAKISMAVLKHPPERDCRDYMDLNLVQMMLNVICKDTS